MKNKLKKIITTTVISAVSLTAIGCGTNNNKLAQNIDKSMENFVSSINNLDYVETSSAKTPTTNRNIGKIVETSASENSTMKIKANGNHIQFLNNDISEAEIENTITIPSERTDNFNLFILTNTPYITFTSDDNNSLNINAKFSTNQIAETSDEIESKINSLILKRSILMIYVNEIYNGNVTLSNENKLAINAYVNVIKENTSFLNGNRGMVKNQLSLASDLVSSEENENLINYYIIKSGEALETRASKLDSTISAIDSIINIIEANLTTSSTYYQTNLSGTYNSLISNTNKIETVNEITESSSNEQIANKIACTLDFCNLNKTDNNTTTNNTPSIANNQNISNDATNLLDNNQKTNQILNQNNSRNSQVNNSRQSNLRNQIKTQNTNQSNTINNHTHNHEIQNANQNNINTQNIQNQNVISRNRNLNNMQTNNLNNSQNTNNVENIENSNTTQNNQSINNENQNVRRIPNSVRQRRHNYQNNAINSSALDIKEENKKARDNSNNTLQNNNIANLNERNHMQTNNRTMRAQRTPENSTQEEYTTTSANTTNEPRATRVPYTSSTNNFQR